MYGLHRTGDIPLRRAVKADGRIVPLFEQQEQSEQLRTAFTALRHPEAQAVKQTCTVILRAVRIRTAERSPSIRAAAIICSVPMPLSSECSS